jgi:hypothetical protein
MSFMILLAFLLILIRNVFLFLFSQGLLEAEKLETLSKQIELDRIAEEFKLLHLERQGLVSRWQVRDDRKPMLESCVF